MFEFPPVFSYVRIQWNSVNLAIESMVRTTAVDMYLLDSSPHPLPVLNVPQIVFLTCIGVRSLVAIFPRQPLI